MDKYIESLRIRLSSLSYRELQKEAKNNSISAKQKKMKIFEALFRKLSRDYQAERAENEAHAEPNSPNKENISTPRDYGEEASKGSASNSDKPENRENIEIEPFTEHKDPINTRDCDEVIAEDFIRAENRENIVIDSVIDNKHEDPIIFRNCDEVISEDYLQSVKPENRNNFTIGPFNERMSMKSVNTPIKPMPKRSYTPYRGSFKYVDTTKMSNRDFELYQEKKKDETNRVLNQRGASVGRNDVNLSFT